MNISIAEAKAKLSELVSRAEAGEEIVLTRHGKIAARLVPPARADLLPRIGALKGKIWIANDFDELGPEWDEYVR
ncbi:MULTISPECIES: type II toxin-antitoxin system Phd/YefM family antitoxin [unclassified Mesorhizobium]|uniref:type II toxin-antitoxin system Phd/YefM family antitoxin n=1 Tax=unclassified Mesorhizobium TaxID=325217 RepID=UPI001126EEB8|nr:MULTISPECIES: type II toxin-antitoxin system prevent-host-death family antitoxin [unclassified Mesorhizobium]MBZ9808447.1 type II toxin-antitoxin system prevent-host-death family antitoxin [Mesorhizobium sp. ESP-6-2]MBZ9941334.1 type II toxin-antitoxin system prevent-host-death family antitoxin [Mesorhizobium sp. BR1-1-13]TPM33420.1 type II toxin-antitoxin system Phd/YefM family antitoxin [Mesorhizobium sp. B2-2-2]